MNIYRQLIEIKKIKNPIITIGTFDGVHLGHQKIIHYLNQIAMKKNGESVIFTFHPHPRMVLFPDNHNIELIQTIDERIEKLATYGLQHLIVFPFTKEFSRLSPLEFIRDILVNQIQMHTIVFGYDHHFGRNREGNISYIKELAPVYGFHVEEVPVFSYDSDNISSTKIRNYIKSGNISKANQYLNFHFQLKGLVVKGDQIGSKINFPTANLFIKEDYKIIPQNGVYAVIIKVKNQKYNGMLNIGNRPTVKNEGEKRIEVHIFDFSSYIYDEEITIDLVEFVREERNFGSLNELKFQLIKDEEKIRNIFTTNFATF